MGFPMGWTEIEPSETLSPGGCGNHRAGNNEKGNHA